MLEGLRPPERITPCAVRKLREGLTETDLGIFDAAILSVEDWPAKTLADALTERGLLIGEKPIRKHRNSICSCTRRGEHA
jgi:hypothetical protein